MKDVPSANYRMSAVENSHASVDSTSRRFVYVLKIFVQVFPLIFPRYESITDPEKIESQPNFYIKIVPDKTNNTLTIEDSGRREILEESSPPTYRRGHCGQEHVVC